MTLIVFIYAYILQTWKFSDMLNYVFTGSVQYFSTGYYFAYTNILNM